MLAVQLILHELEKVIKALKLTTCRLDHLPSKVLKELLPAVGPAILPVMNLSLSTVLIPSSFKAAVIKLLLKKPGLDPELVSIYWPISNLPFRSKVQERVVAKQQSIQTCPVQVQKLPLN